MPDKKSTITNKSPIIPSIDATITIHAEGYEQIGLVIRKLKELGVTFDKINAEQEALRNGTT